MTAFLLCFHCVHYNDNNKFIWLGPQLHYTAFRCAHTDTAQWTYIFIYSVELNCVSRAWRYFLSSHSSRLEFNWIITGDSRMRRLPSNRWDAMEKPKIPSNNFIFTLHINLSVLAAFVLISYEVHSALNLFVFFLLLSISDLRENYVEKVGFIVLWDPISKGCRNRKKKFE